MNDDELAFTCMQEEGVEFEAKVFEMLFGSDARPPKNIDEYGRDRPSAHQARIFSYEEAQEALAEVGKSLQLLHMIKEYFACPSEEEEDTEENWKIRELIEEFRADLDRFSEELIEEFRAEEFRADLDRLSG